MKRLVPWSEVLNLTKAARIDDPMEAWDFKLLAKLVLAINKVLVVSSKDSDAGPITQAVRQLLRGILTEAGIDPEA